MLIAVLTGSLRDSGERRLRACVRRQLAEHRRQAACAPQTQLRRAPNFNVVYTTAPEARPRCRLPRLDALAAASRKQGDQATRLFPTEQARESKLCNAPLT